MIKQIAGPGKYGDIRYRRKFAWVPTEVVRETDGSRFKIWFLWYVVEERYSLMQGWSEWYRYLPA